MAKFSEYLSEIKNQTDELRLVVTEKSGTDCSGLSISEVSAVVERLSTDGSDVPVLQDKSVNPQTYSQKIKADAGFDGLSSVDVMAVTSSIDKNITPTNIRTGVTILGVEGNLEADKPDQSKTVVPTTTQQTIFADTGYELGSVVVEAVTNTIDSNIKASNIRKGSTILGVTGSYEGGSLQSKTVTPTTSEQKIVPDEKYYGLSAVNIRAVNPSDYQKIEEAVTIAPTTEVQTITPATNVVFNSVVVDAVKSGIDANIMPENIRRDVTILGVTGVLDEGGGSEDLSLELNEQITAIDALQEAVDRLPEQDNPSTSTFDRLQWKCDNMKSLQYEFVNYQGEDVDVVLNGLDTSKVETMSYMFQNAPNLKRISYLNMESATSAINIASKAYALEDVNFKNIRVNGTFSLSTHSNLTVESLVNIIKELWRLDGDGNTHKLTLGSTNTAKLSNVRVRLLGVSGELMDADPHADKKEPCEVFLDGSDGDMGIMDYATMKGWTVT